MMLVDAAIKPLAYRTLGIVGMNMVAVGIVWMSALPLLIKLGFIALSLLMSYQLWMLLPRGYWRLTQYSYMDWELEQDETPLSVRRQSLKLKAIQPWLGAMLLVFSDARSRQHKILLFKHQLETQQWRKLQICARLSSQ